MSESAAVSYPRVGIRPVIDARQGGVRESLEEQTMGMARRAAALITGSLRYPDGRPVECVLADTTIGRVPEAAACAAKFEREGVGLTLTVTPCWCYGTETIDLHPFYPKAIWGFNGTERPGRYIWRRRLPAMPRRGCRPSVFMAVMCRIIPTPPFLPMWRRRSFGL